MFLILILAEGAFISAENGVLKSKAVTEGPYAFQKVDRSNFVVWESILRR